MERLRRGSEAANMYFVFLSSSCVHVFDDIRERLRHPPWCLLHRHRVFWTGAKAPQDLLCCQRQRQDRESARASADLFLSGVVSSIGAIQCEISWNLKSKCFEGTFLDMFALFYPRHWTLKAATVKLNRVVSCRNQWRSRATCWKWWRRGRKRGRDAGLSSKTESCSTINHLWVFFFIYSFLFNIYMFQATLKLHYNS